MLNRLRIIYSSSNRVRYRRRADSRRGFFRHSSNGSRIDRLDDRRDRRGAAAESIAASSNLPAQVVEDAYHELNDAHVIVLERGTTAIWSAPPFSAVPTPFGVRCAAASWYAPCAWDAFGIPAALHRDASIDARCAWSGEQMRCGVDRGKSYGAGVIHLLVPAARFWDDIVYT